MDQLEKELRALEKKVLDRKLELEGRLDFDMSANLKAELHEKVEQLGKVQDGLEIAIKGLEPIW